MADPVLNALDLITMEGLDRSSYIEDPEDILNQNWYEQYRQLQPALEATEARASATIGPKETGPIEDVVGGFYASNKLAPIAAFIDDITPGIPFADIIPDPPDELPDGGNRMRNTLNTIAIVDALPGLAKMGTGAFKKGSDLYKNWKSTKYYENYARMPYKERIMRTLDPISPIDLFRLAQDPKKTLKQAIGYRLVEATRKSFADNPLSQTFKIKSDSKFLKVSKPNPELGWKGGTKSLDPRLQEQGWQLYWDKNGQGYVTRLTEQGNKVVKESRRELYNVLKSKKEWGKFKNTYGDLINPPKYDEYIVDIPRSYKQYKKFLKDRLITNYHKRIGDLKIAPGTNISMLADEPSAIGRFQPNFLGGKIGKTDIPEYPIAIATKLGTKDFFKSILRHELKHYLDYEVVGLGGKYGASGSQRKVYEGMEDMYQGLLRDDVFNALGQWKMRQSIALKEYKSANPQWKTTGVPADLVPIQPSLRKALYYIEPTEVSARFTQLKTKTPIEKLQDFIGIRNQSWDDSPINQLHPAEQDLLSVFDQKTIDKLKKTVWGGAAPFMFEDEVYEDLK